MDEAPVAFSALLPFWLTLLIGGIVGLAGLYLVRRMVRGGPTFRPAHRDYVRRDVVVPLAVAGACVLALIGLALDIANDGLITRTFDVPVHDWFLRHRVDGLTPVVVVLTNLVSPFGTTILAIALATLAAWKSRSWVPALMLFIGPAMAGLLVRLTKWLAPRGRPDQLSQVVLTIEPSFPSGHVAGAASLYGCIVLVVAVGYLGPAGRGRIIRYSVIAGAAAILVGLTRLYLAVHWFTDVTAGLLLAGIAISGTLAAYRQYARIRPPVG